MRASVKTSFLGRIPKCIAAFVALACFTTGLHAQILVGAGGAGPFGFGPTETPPPTDWATLDITTGSASTYETPAAVDAAAQTFDQSTITTQLPTIGGIGTARLTRHSTNNQYLFTQPTGVPLGVLKATLRNNSGAQISGITVSYNYIVALAGVTDQVPGHRAFYSTNGLPNTWQPLPAFSGLTASAFVSAGIPLETWIDGSDIYLLWLDDNNLTGNDGSFAIDNFSVAIGLPPCPGITNQPQNVTITDCTASSVAFSISVTGALSGVQWYRNNGSGFTAIPGANAATYTLTPVGLGDSGSQFQAVITGSGSCVETSTVATLTVNADTAPPVPLYAARYLNRTNFTGTNITLTNITVVFSENIDTNNNDLYTNWLLTDTNTVPPTAVNLIGQTYLNSTTVLLETDPLDPTHGYTLEMQLVFDTCANNEMPLTTIPVLTYLSKPLTLTSTWKYLDTDVDPGPNWFLPGFDDSSWLSGPGPFDAKRDANYPVPPTDCRSNTLYQMQGPIPTCIRLESPVTLTNNITVNFRTHFNYAGNSNLTLLQLNGKFDDGAIVWLNGVEVWRVGLPQSGVTRGTFATRTVGDGEFRDIILLFSNTNLIHTGDNVIAVELHQQNLTSSDLTMGLEINVITAEALAGPPVEPEMFINNNAGVITITWDPPIGTLQRSLDISSPANWVTIPGASSPFITNAPPAIQFFRVTVP